MIVIAEKVRGCDKRREKACGLKPQGYHINQYVPLKHIATSWLHLFSSIINESEGESPWMVALASVGPSIHTTVYYRYTIAL